MDRFFISISLISYLKLPMSVSVIEFSSVARNGCSQKAQKIYVIILGYCQPFSRENQASQTVDYFP